MKILIVQNKEIFVDDDVFYWAKHFKWQIGSKGHIYIHQSSGYRFLHRIVMDTPNDMLCDHRDRNPFNNTRENLRNCTIAENAANRTWRIGNTGYRGVSKDNRRVGKPYRAAIQHEGKRITLGTYDSPEKAALAYDKAAKELHGDFAMLNFE